MMAKTKVGKAPGLDLIPGELLKRHAPQLGPVTEAKVLTNSRLAWWATCLLQGNY